jgi:hypothetical protein
MKPKKKSREGDSLLGMIHYCVDYVMIELWCIIVTSVIEPQRIFHGPLRYPATRANSDWLRNRQTVSSFFYCDKVSIYIQKSVTTPPTE